MSVDFFLFHCWCCCYCRCCRCCSRHSFLRSWLFSRPILQHIARLNDGILLNLSIITSCRLRLKLNPTISMEIAFYSFYFHIISFLSVFLGQRLPLVLLGMCVRAGFVLAMVVCCYCFCCCAFFFFGSEFGSTGFKCVFSFSLRFNWPEIDW